MTRDCPRAQLNASPSHSASRSQRHRESTAPAVALPDKRLQALSPDCRPTSCPPADGGRAVSRRRRGRYRTPRQRANPRWSRRCRGKKGTVPFLSHVVRLGERLDPHMPKGGHEGDSHFYGRSGRLALQSASATSNTRNGQSQFGASWWRWSGVKKQDSESSRIGWLFPTAPRSGSQYGQPGCTLRRSFRSLQSPGKLLHKTTAGPPVNRAAPRSVKRKSGFVRRNLWALDPSRRERGRTPAAAGWPRSPRSPCKRWSDPFRPFGPAGKCDSWRLEPNGCDVRGCRCPAKSAPGRRWRTRHVDRGGRWRARWCHSGCETILGATLKGGMGSTWVQERPPSLL